MDLIESCSVPVLHWLPNYSISLLAGDTAAALTLTCLLVPQSMSYASSLAHLSPVNGLFGVAIPSIVYAILGSSPQLSVGPEAALSLMTGETIASIFSRTSRDTNKSEAEHADLALTLASLITLQAGFVAFALGVLRLGFLDAVLSKPLLRGFITAVGVVIIVSQAIPMLGLSQLASALHIDKSTTFQKMVFLVANVKQAHLLTTVLSACTLCFLILARVFKSHYVVQKGITWIRYVPEVLLVVITATITCALCRWDHKGLAILGHITAGHVHPHLPFVGITTYFQDTIGTAVTIAIVGYVDSICGAKESASRFNYSISPNRELVALGAGNMAASMASGSLVGFGSISAMRAIARSRLNASAGARSPMAGLLAGLFVLLTTFCLLRFLYFLPKSTLACIVTMVVYSIILELPHDLMYFVKMRAWTELALMGATFLLTVFWSLRAGIVISIALSLIMVIAKSSTVSIKIMGRAPGSRHWVTITDAHEHDEEIPGVLVVRVRELNFANAGMLKDKLRRLERYGNKKHHPSDTPYRQEANVVVFHMADVDRIDAPALQVLLEVIQAYMQHGVICLFAHVEPDLEPWFSRAGITETVGINAFHESVHDALVHCRSH